MSLDLIHCIYASAETQSFDTNALTELLKKARANNERLGLTGMLLYAEGSFFQVLEGAETVVDALYAKILLDPRHRKIAKIVREPIAKRSFADWTMGFYNISRKELAGIAGVNDFFAEGRSLTDLDAGRAKKLLAAFREGHWHKLA